MAFVVYSTDVMEVSGLILIFCYAAWNQMAPICSQWWGEEDN